MRKIYELLEFLSTDTEWEGESLGLKSLNSFMNVFEIRDDVDNSDKSLEDMLPDTYGADRLFIKGFLNNDLLFDFWTVFRDFLKHNFSALKDYAELTSLFDDEMNKGQPENFVKEYLFSYMYCAAKSGNEYSIALFKYLYKTYYKKEYNQLKRFRKISAREVYNFTHETDDDYIFTITIARIIGMCSLLGIEFDRDMAGVFALLNGACIEFFMNEQEDVLEFEEGMYLECLEQIDTWGMEKKYKEPRKYMKDQVFIDKCFLRFGFGNNYLMMCDNTCESTEETFAQVLAILKLIYPGREFSYEEVQSYAGLYKLTDIIANTIREYEDLPNVILGMESKVLGTYDGENCLFKPEKINVLSKSQKKEEVNAVNIAVLPHEEIKESDYLEEISQLRRKLREKESESKHFRMQLDQTKVALKEANELLKKYENDRTELISLRNHVYSQSMEDKEESEVNISDMKKKIESRKIVIVGGHTNFVNKLRKEFPKWKFYDANVNKVNETLALDGIEKLYFFTNHMSHSVYSKYVACVRERRIPLGYLHTVNIESLIKQIYGELVK